MLVQGACHALSTVALILCGMWAFRRCSSRRTIGVTAVASVRQLLSPPGISTNDQLHSRALPNLRLVRAFGLTNAFVSSSVQVHSNFTHRARRLLSAATTRGDWRGFTEQSIDIIQRHLTNHTGPLEYSTTIQHITLKIVLCGLFEVPLAELDDDRGIALIAFGINELWRLSKTEQDLPADLLPSMNAYLRAWIPDIENPLDFLIPTFETLWRVVAVTIAYVHKDEDVRHTLQQFLHDPTKSQFDQFSPNGPSVGAVVAEVMRLHPPTRRISRASITPQSQHHFAAFERILSLLSASPTIYAADIGAVQRDSTIWGLTADRFEPMRHHPDTLTEHQRQALLGFGFGKLKCVASSWAPLAVGVICAAVLDQLDWHGLELTEGEGIGGREGWNGWSII